MHGALLINKPRDLSSFGVIQKIKNLLCQEAHVKPKALPKLGHGGTLDPFATGVLVVLVGNGAKLARYFLNSSKKYSGTIYFGKSTASGDLTNDVINTTETLPTSLEELQKKATDFTLTPYLQTPPMYSAKKQNGKPLYELARKGIEVKREPKECILYDFNILQYNAPLCQFEVSCSSGTYIRTLAEDLAIQCQSLGHLTQLCRTESGPFKIEDSTTLEQVELEIKEQKKLHECSGWINFDDLLRHYPKVEATEQETLMISQGKQNVLFQILNRASEIPLTDHLTIYSQNKLRAIIRCTHPGWEIERVFK